MKKKIGILALVLAIVMCFFTISAFAAGDENGNFQMPFSDSEQVTPEHPDIQTEVDLFEEFEEVFGDLGGEMVFLMLSITLSIFLFFPALVLMIVFIIFNNNTKKKVREYERFFGPLPENKGNYYNPYVNNAPYGTQPVNPSNIPIGTAPAGNQYIPQNDVNNQQGGQSDEKY